MDEDKKAIVLPEQAGVVAPVEVDDLVKMVQAFETFKARVLTKKDFWKDREGEPHVKKSGWLKYATACNISLKKLDERYEERELPKGSGKWVFVYHFDYRAIAPSGRYADASGSASSDEREESGKIIHDTRSLAQTRAMNRAISNIVGAGEISAEEISASAHKNRRPTPRTHRNSKPVVLRPLGKINLNIIEYNIKAAEKTYGIPLVDIVDVIEDARGFNVLPTRKLTKEERYLINGMIKTLGGVWNDKEPFGAWRIPRSE